MALHSLSIHATPGSWRLFAARKADPAFQKFSEKVWERDDYICQFCGFQARIYQEVVNLDQNYNNNKLENMATGCCFCAQCFFLEAVGKNDYGGGSIIYMPEISQSELNGLSHVLFCAIANATNYRANAQAIYRSLKLRAQSVEEQLGEGMSHPSFLGQLLIEAAGPAESILQNLRLLPSRSKFTQQIDEWAKIAMEELAVEQPS